MLHNLDLGQAVKSWTNRWIVIGAMFHIANQATASVDPGSVASVLHLDPLWSAVLTGVFALFAIWRRNHPVQGVPGKDPKAN